MHKKNTTVRKTKEAKNKIVSDKETKSEIICDQQIKNKNDIFDEQCYPDISCESNQTPCTEHMMIRYDQKLLQNIEISGIDRKYKQVCEEILL